MKISTEAAKFFYLFTRDVVSVADETAAAYEAREPGFAPPFFSAYLAAFLEPSKGKITHELLQTINKASLQHLRDHPAGEYRTAGVRFPVSINAYTQGKRTIFCPDYNATVPGILAYISKWILGMHPPTHTISFVSKVKGLQDHYKVIYLEDTLYFRHFLDDAYTDEPFNEAEHQERIRALIFNDNYQCYFESDFTADSSRVQQGIQDKIQGVIDSFDQMILHAKTEDEIIAVIAQHLQMLAQIHPFLDGNTRTWYILLNKLLHDYHLPLSIIYNPNKFDACPLEDLIQMIKDGQRAYQQLLTHTNPNDFIIETDEMGAKYKTIHCPPDTTTNPELLLQFQSLVVQENATMLSTDHLALVQAVEKLVKTIVHPDCSLCDLQFGISIEMPSKLSQSELTAYARTLEQAGVLVAISTNNYSFPAPSSKLIIHNETLESFKAKLSPIELSSVNTLKA